MKSKLVVNMKSMTKSAVALAFVLLVASPLAAQERNLKLSLFYSQVEAQGETAFSEDPAMDLEFEDGDGFGASVNMFYGSHFSVEAAVFNVRSDAAIALDSPFGIDLGTLSLTPISLGAQFHILGDSRIDPYIGAGGAYILGGDLLSQDTEAGGLGRIELDSEATYYINAGLALQLTDCFGIVVDARQYQYEPSSQSSVTGTEVDLEINPRIYSAGLRLRF